MAVTNTIAVKVGNGASAGQIFQAASAARMHIGSGFDVEIRIADDPLVTSRHVQLDFDPPECRIQVLDDQPKVSFNRQMIRQATLIAGDCLVVGRTSFQIISTGTVDDSADTGEYGRILFSESGGDSTMELAVISDQTAASTNPKSVQIVAPPGYEIVRCIGRGGMGVVFEVMNLAKKTRMAMKFLHPRHSSCERSMSLFLREVNVLSQLKHPRIVHFHEMGWVSGRVFLAMEYVDVLDFPRLLDLASPEKRIRVSVGIICQVLDALSYAHSKQVVHRDVKPTNILVFRDAKGLQSRLSDFGLARTFENAGLSGGVGDGEIRGTMSYMAPEQLRDGVRAKPSADIYSVGVSLFYLLSDRMPFPRFTSIPERLKSLDLPPASLGSYVSNVPAGLSEILSKSMALDPDSRFGSAKEMRAALQPYTRIGLK